MIDIDYEAIMEQKKSVNEEPMVTESQVPDLVIPDGAVDISPEKSGGVWKIVLKEGAGNANPGTGDSCYVHYVGTLVDGTKFDSSRDRGEPFEFKVGRSQVIKGWDIAVATMKKGELCKIFLKPEFGYGALGSEPRIPPNSPLIFEIELLKWEGEDISPDKDKSIFRTIIKDGGKYDTPSEGSKVDAHVVGLHNGREFMNTDVQFVLGEASETGLPEVMDKVVKSFNKGERSLVHMKSRWAYGKEGSAEYNIPPNADVDFEIELKEFEKARQSWEMDDDEKLAEAGKLKQRGTEFFQQGKNKLALAKYKAIIELLQHETHLEGDKKQQHDALMIAAHNNLAMVYLKMSETMEAIKQSEKVLELDEKNVKALYRKGQALQNQNDFEDAIKVYNHLLEFEPENKAAQSARINCRARLGDEIKRQKAVYANIFQKMAKSNESEGSPKVNEQPSSVSKNGVEKQTESEAAPNVEAAA